MACVLPSVIRLSINSFFVVLLCLQLFLIKQYLLLLVFEPFSVKKTTTIFLNHRKNISMRIKLPLSSVTKSFNFNIITQL